MTLSLAAFLRLFVSRLIRCFVIISSISGIRYFLGLRKAIYKPLFAEAILILLGMGVLFACETLKPWGGDLRQREAVPTEVAVDTGEDRASPFSLAKEPRDLKNRPLTDEERRRYWSEWHEEAAQSDLWIQGFKRRLSDYSERWVKQDGVALYLEPSTAKPSEVEPLQKGDRVWVREFLGDWVRLRDGLYVQGVELSDKPPILDEMYLEEDLFSNTLD